MSLIRRTGARRAGRALLWAALSFVVAQLGLGVAVERWLPGVRDPEYAAKFERLEARRAEAPGRPLVLVLGSSRVEMGLVAGRVRAALANRPALVFNFGLSGGGSLLEAIALRRLLAAGVRPDLLVLEVLPLTLNQPGARPVEEEWLDAARLTWDEIRFVRRYSADRRSLLQWLKGRAFPCERHHHGLRCGVALDSADPAARPERTPRPTDAFGWSPSLCEDVTPEERRSHAAFATAQYEAARGDFRLAEGPTQALRESLALCRREGVPVALLLMPEGEAFRSQWSPATRAALDEAVAGLARAADVSLIDTRAWMNEDAFWDGHHLQPRGAVAFTERFASEVIPALVSAGVKPAARPDPAEVPHADWLRQR